MKALPLVILAIAGASSLADLTKSDNVNSPAAIPAASPSQPVAQQDPDAHWSIVGKWYCQDPGVWTDTVTFSADGTFIRDQGRDTGRWTLTGMKDHVVVIMDWDKWGKFISTLAGPNLFKDGNFTMERIEPQVVAPALGSVETRSWHQGEPPVRIMRQDEGFCALSAVTGHFEGGGEGVRVYVDTDGYWYLGGKSQQQGVAAQCIVVRYAR